jgi:hypothetical protein
VCGPVGRVLSGPLGPAGPGGSALIGLASGKSPKDSLNAALDPAHIVLGKPQDTTAQDAAAIEANRQHAITENTGKVNSEFAGFDDNYYKGLGDNYRQYYTPQLDRQQKRARDSLTFNLGRSGNLDSSTGAKDFGDLQGTYDAGRANIGSGALEYEQGQRSTIEGARANLLNSVNSAADPTAAANLAGVAAQIASRPPAYSPLGDLFSQYTSQAANNQALQGQGYAGNPMFNWLTNMFQQGGGAPSISYSGG